MPYVDSTKLQEYTIKLVNKLKTLFSSPLKAATVAAMTDTTKVYVYTGSEDGYTAGNWYYFDGEEWTDGGVYNAVAVNTDTNLIAPGEAADAKATGDRIASVQSELEEYADIFTGDVDESVKNWLDEHPEATTTVQDGSLTEEKFSEELKKKKASYYNSISDLKNDPSLKSGMTAVTLGYYSKNDGGGATYVIRDLDSDVDNGGNIHALNNGKVAELLFTKKVSLRQFGADGNTATDETAIVQNAIDYVVSMGGGQVIFDAPILIDNTVYVNPGEDGAYLEITGITNTVSTGGTGMYYSGNNIIRNTAGDIFSINRDQNGRPFYNRQWSKFAARNLQIYVHNVANDVIAFHCVKDNNAIFENILFYGVYTSIKYDYSYLNANNETVVTYNDYTKIINCHTFQCKYIAYELSTGENKSVIDSSCMWCASGIKHGVKLTNCRNILVKNFMFGNEVQEAAAEAAVITAVGSYVLVEDIYVEFSGMPVIRADGSYVKIGSLYLKFDYPSIVYLTSGSEIIIDSLHVVNGRRTGTYDVLGTGGIIKIKRSNVDILASPWTNVIIEFLNTLMCRLYRRSGSSVAFANINNNDGYYPLFARDNTDVYQAGLVDGIVNWGSFKLGVLVGVEIVTQDTNTVRTEVKSLDLTNGLKMAILNTDGSNATSIPTGYQCLVRFYYKAS